MKKATKVSLVAALAVSALTPAMAIGAETNNAAAGFYNVDNGQVVTADAFVLLSNTEKVNLLKNSNVYYADGEGKVVQATKIIDSKTDAALVAALFPETELEADKNVTLTPEGTVVPGQSVAPKVESVKAINANEVTLTFNTEMLKSAAEDVANYTFTAVAPSAQGAITPTDIQLQADGKTAVVRFANNDLVDATKYKVEAKNILSKDYKEVAKYEGELTFSADKSAPVLSDAMVSGTDLLLTFNEEVDFASAVLKVDGKEISLSAAAATNSGDAGDYTYEVDASAVTSVLSKGTHSLSLVGIKDVVGNEAGTITKSYTVADDVVAPTFSKIEAIDKDTFKITFSETVTQPTFKVLKGSTEFVATPVEAGPAKVYTVDVANTAGTNKLYETNESSVALKVEASNFKDNAGLFGNTFNTTVALQRDTVAPKLLNNDLNTVASSALDTVVKVVFDETIAIADASKIKVIDPEGIELANTPTLTTGPKGANTAINATLTGVTPKAGTYKVVFSEGAVVDTDLNKNAAVTANATFKADETYVVPTSVTPATDNSITVVYPSEVTNSALNVANYKLDNGALPAGTTAVFTTADKDTVKIQLPSTFKIVDDANYKFEITQNVKTTAGDTVVANAGAATKTNYTENIQLSDNVAPELVSAKYVTANTGDTTATQIKLTFSEGLATIAADEASLINDLLLKVNGTTVATTGNTAVTANDKEILVTIPSTNINQTTTIGVVAEGTDNAALVITDNSTAKNKIKAPATVTVTK
ncbi:hypothetical protein CSV78_04015 [Sporosarcina sp. P16a]|uniref:hypothetical protein n=1 Tax=unclassified Sporosarcina TaxID=2647733 RepID=UPI000C163014|nr:MULTISPECIES: hypothetical protein [unclassified Sporosarcina]PIC67966.1 hypothetical protein CSV78_04015 [Sporosarcina sp. P16a]PIC94275.1 hypothetical protein CSV70_00655 [Sporosarcina sp. P25]